MTDEELITALRMRAESELCQAAADRIHSLGLLHDMAEAKAEALVKDKRWIMEERDRTFALMLARAEAAEAALAAEKARAERLEAALVEHNDLLRSALAIAKREGVEGQIASTNWDAYYNRVAVALKRHHQTANEARAAITEAGQ